MAEHSRSDVDAVARSGERGLQYMLLGQKKLYIYLLSGYCVRCIALWFCICLDDFFCMLGLVFGPAFQQNEASLMSESDTPKNSTHFSCTLAWCVCITRTHSSSDYSAIWRNTQIPLKYFGLQCAAYLCEGTGCC